MSATTISSYGGNGQKDVYSRRMLKKTIQRRSRIVQTLNVPQGYASALHSLRPCWMVFLSILRRRFVFEQGERPSKFCLSNMVFPQPAGFGKKPELLASSK